FDAASLESLLEHVVDARGRGFIAGLISRKRDDGGGTILIVQQRKKRDFQRRIGTGDAGAGGRKASIFNVADADSGFDVGRSHSVHDRFGSTVIDVVVG